MITQKILNQFLELALKKLEGDWVLLGGTLLPLLGSTERVTVDIDVASISPQTQNQSLKIMECAEQLKLPIETINSAASYFLNKIPQFEKKLILIQSSKKCRIYRPNLMLFIELKISRLTEYDMNDCLFYINHEKKNQKIPKNKIIQLLNKKLNQEKNPEKQKRLNTLIQKMNKIN